MLPGIAGVDGEFCHLCHVFLFAALQMGRNAADHTGDVLPAVEQHTLCRHEAVFQTAHISHTDKAVRRDLRDHKAHLIQMRIQQHVGLSRLTAAQCAADIAADDPHCVAERAQQLRCGFCNGGLAAGNTRRRRQLL